MVKQFIPTTEFLDDPWTKKAKKGEDTTDQGTSLISFAEARECVARDRLAKLVCVSGAIKHPEGPTGMRYVDHLQTIFGYLIAARLNAFDKIQMSLCYMFPNHAKRERIAKILKVSGVMAEIQKGYSFGKNAKLSVWEIDNTIWEYLTDDAVKTINAAYVVNEKSNGVVGLKMKDGNKTIKVRYEVECVNDALIKEIGKKYPYMLGFQTVYNDAECKTNGRIYHRIQGMKQENREGMLSFLNGCKMVTVDIKSSLPRLTLKVMGKRIGWSEDLYDLDGVKDISRDSKKLATTIYINADNHKMYAAKAKCAERNGENLTWDQMKRFSAALNKLTCGIIGKSKHLGLRVMNIEGRMQTKMLQWSIENDIPWFPMHDGGHCPEWAAEAAERHMQQVIDQIISEMSFAERAEILGITEDELLQVMAGITLKSKEPKKQAKKGSVVKKQDKTSVLDDGDTAFLRQMGLIA